MKKFLIPVLSIMLLLPFMYGGCLSSEDLAEQFFDVNLPDLAGTWTGAGEWFPPPIDLERLGVSGTLVKLQLTLDENGDITDATVDDGEVPVGLFTGVTGTVSNFEPDLVEFSFSNNYTGGLIGNFANLKYVYFFTHDDTDMPFAHGVLEQGASTLPNAISSDLVGTWSGFGFDFNDATGAAERFNLTNVNISMDEGLSITGTDADGNSLSGYLNLQDGEHGYFDGGVMVGDMMTFNYIKYGFLSPDKTTIGFMYWPESAYYEGVWSVVLLTKQPG